MRFNVLFSMFAGIVLFLAWHYFMGMSWKTEGSIDIVAGAILEFFFLQTILQTYNQKNQRQFQKNTSDHLKRIEQLEKELKTQHDDVVAELKEIVKKEPTN